MIEDARPGDLTAILSILNHYILSDHCTFDTEPWTEAQKQSWFEAFTGTGKHRLLVAREDDTVLAYAHSAPWRPKAAYKVTVETTVYVAPGATGRGLGRQLLSTLLEVIRGSGALRAVAGIAQPNDASNALHQTLGYRAVGTFHGVGRKFKRDWDVTWFERNIEDPA
ncbi:MAG: N-acetyltransferase family protein [Pseudomonadota bacterium]